MLMGSIREPVLNVSQQIQYQQAHQQRTQPFERRAEVSEFPSSPNYAPSPQFASVQQEIGVTSPINHTSIIPQQHTSTQRQNKHVSQNQFQAAYWNTPQAHAAGTSHLAANAYPSALNAYPSALNAYPAASTVIYGENVHPSASTTIQDENTSASTTNQNENAYPPASTIIHDENAYPSASTRTVQDDTATAPPKKKRGRPRKWACEEDRRAAEAQRRRDTTKAKKLGLPMPPRPAGTFQPPPDNGSDPNRRHFIDIDKDYGHHTPGTEGALTARDVIVGRWELG
jgi:hypothetical protein